MAERDPVTAYAASVRDGRDAMGRPVVIGRLVKLACERHERDVKEAAALGLDWRPEAACDAIDFFREILRLPEETAAKEAVSEDDAFAPDDGTPFTLSPWQEFIVGSLMGWYTVNGFRRFRTGYIETAKGSGKTPLCAGLLLYILVADGERGAQLFFAAVSKEQAGIAFADAEKMVKASPALRELLDCKVNNIAWLERGSFLRAISAEKRGLDGKRVSGAVIDELHEHPKPVVVNKMRKGTKGRRNALILEPTNSGYDRTSVCWHHHEYSQKVLERSIADDAWFAYVCGLDPCPACLDAGNQFPVEGCEDCDDWKTEGPHWLKPNPNLGVSLSWQYVRELVRQARGMPSEVNDLLRFNFCVWTQQHSRFVNMAKWQIAPKPPSDEELIGVRCFGGIDLGETDDLSSFALLFEFEDGRSYARVRTWIPKGTLERQSDRPYAEWQRAGVLEVTDGEITDFNVVQAAIEADCLKYGVQKCGYDKRFAQQMASNLEAAGIAMWDVPQGFQQTEPLKRLAADIVDRTFAHGDNPVLTWAASNVVVRHGRNKEVRLDKETAADKIDPFSAVVMAKTMAIRTPLQTESVYDTRGPLVYG